MPGGFKESPLRLNQGLGQLEDWNEETIKTRTERLSNTAISVWPIPFLDPDTLQAYRPKAEAKTGYTISDHPYLCSGNEKYGDKVPQIFEEFRQQVMALDLVITEEFLKLYVAYKAETNFVDVVPQAKRLRLSLNMPFAEIDDPHEKCKDVSGLGRWGNGDVEIILSSLEELPYIMSLVRQSFERQMGDGSEQ
jgi:predicted transport protein